jgi:hypothetical protein
MSHFSKRDYETLTKILQKGLVRAKNSTYSWGPYEDVLPNFIEFVKDFAKDLSDHEPNFHRELFIHNVLCSDSNSHDLSSCPYNS